MSAGTFSTRANEQRPWGLRYGRSLDPLDARDGGGVVRYGPFALDEKKEAMKRATEEAQRAAAVEAAKQKSKEASAAAVAAATVEATAGAVSDFVDRHATLIYGGIIAVCAAAAWIATRK